MGNVSFKSKSSSVQQLRGGAWGMGYRQLVNLYEISDFCKLSFRLNKFLLFGRALCVCGIF